MSENLPNVPIPPLVELLTNIARLSLPDAVVRLGPSVETKETAEFSTSNRCNYQQAASYLGISINALRALVFRKRIPHLRIGERSVVFNRADLDAWLLAKRVR